MKNNLQYNVIGLMSGTSLDGVDIAYCKFLKSEGKWGFEIVHAETVKYSEKWKKVLGNLEKENALYFQQIHLEYGLYLGSLVNEFNHKHSIKPDFVSSHGHTIVHTDVKCSMLNKQSKKLTVQIGAGSAIAAECCLPVVCDFRTLDAALGGQGAPLVPIGDELLFAEYEYCLNLGGFANISYQHQGKRVANDICPVNIVMNELCVGLGKEYDDGGELASKGKVNKALLLALNQLAYYKLPLHQPKSLGKEWVEEHIFPLLKKHQLSINDCLRTMVEHIVIQIENALGEKSEKRILVTGGGTHNTFLIKTLQAKMSHQFIIPDKNTIEFKEALVFAFLGVLRIREETNCLKSVTGARVDNIGGAVYLMK